MTYSVLEVAYDGVFCDAVSEAHDGYFCVLEPPRPRGGGGRRRYPPGNDVDLEALKARTRRLRDQRDMADLGAIIRILAKVLR